MSGLKRLIGWMVQRIWARSSKEREPFWSVSKGVKNQFFLILSGFWLASLALSIYLTLNCAEGTNPDCQPAQSVASAIYGVLERFSKIAMGATIAAAMVTPPLVFMGDIAMGIYEAISERWGKIATERRMAEVADKALAQGRAEAAAQAAAEAAEAAEAAAEALAQGRAESYAEGVADERARQEAERQEQQNRENGSQQ